MSKEATLSDGNTKVFISYSRKDRQRVAKLSDALNAQQDITVFRDTEDILPTEEWKKRLEQLISEADTIVFALSPHSAVSEVCAWEVEYAESLNKRIAPVVLRDVQAGKIPKALTKLNYIFFTPRDDFDKAFENLVKALNTNIEWIREHTRLGELAGRWEKQRQLSSRLMRGQELADAETWLTTQPALAPSPTGVHREFIVESRRAATRRQRFWIGGSLAAAVMASVLLLFAVWQMLEAESQRGIAESNARTASLERDRAVAAEQLAEDQRRRAEQQRNTALETESRFLAEFAAERLDGGDAVTAALLAMAAFVDEEAEDNTQRTRPYVPMAGASLLSSLLGMQEATVFSGHSNWVGAVAFSSDGTRLATASGDNTARIWDLRSGEEIAVLLGHEEWLSDVAFSPDDTRVVTASGDGTARIWDANTGFEISILKGHSRPVTAVAFSPDGSRIVTASNDDTVRLWSTAQGEETAVLRGHKFRVRTVAFSPGGTLVVTGSDDTTARVWNATTGEQITVLRGHESYVEAVSFSPDGTRILTAGDNTARIWSTATGVQILTLSGHSDSVRLASFSNDGTRILTGSDDNSARIWNAHTGTQIAVLQGHDSGAYEPGGYEGGLTAAAFSTEGIRVITASGDGTARIWDSETGEEIQVLRGHEDAVLAAAFSPNDSRVVTTSADKTMRIWNVDAGVEVRMLAGHAYVVSSAMFSPDGSKVITTSWDHTARIWDVESGVETTVLRGHAGVVETGEFSLDGDRVVTASGDGTARIWDVKTGSELTVLRVRKPTGERAQSWTRVERAEFTPDGSRVVTKSSDDIGRIWDAATGHELVAQRGLQYAVPVAEHSFDGTRILTAHPRNDTATIWNAISGTKIATLEGHEGSVEAAAFSPDATKVVTASRDNSVRLWDVATGNLIAVLRGHSGAVWVVTYSFDGKFILTGSQDKTARLWDAKSGSEVAVLLGHLGDVRAVAFSPDGDRIITGSQDGTARIWPFVSNAQELVRRAKAVVPRCLTLKQREEFHLRPEPPAWCIDGAKWPYNTDTWRARLAERRAQRKSQESN